VPYPAGPMPRRRHERSVSGVRPSIIAASHEFLLPEKQIESKALARGTVDPKPSFETSAFVG
jgi:hypothetical protein